MALENSSFGVLPPDYFNKEKTLASNATAPPVPPLAKNTAPIIGNPSIGSNPYLQPGQIPGAPLPNVTTGTITNPVIGNPAVGPNPYLQPGQIPSGLNVSAPAAPTVQAPTPPKVEAPVVKPVVAPEAQKKSYLSTTTIPAPQSYLDARALEEQQKKLDETTKNIKEKFNQAMAPAPEVAGAGAAPKVSGMKPLSSQDLMKPIDELYDLQKGVTRQQYLAETQFKQDQLAQQIAEADKRGVGISNAFYKSLMRDQDTLFTSAMRSLNENYLAKKSQVIESEYAKEQARLDEFSDDMFGLLKSTQDPKIQAELIKSMAESTGLPQWVELSNNPAALKTLSAMADQNAQAKFLDEKQKAFAMLADKSITDSQREVGFKDHMSKAMPDVSFQAKTWAGSDSALKELQEFYGKENGQKMYESLLQTGDEGVNEMFMDLLYKKGIKEDENLTFIGNFKKLMPPADTKAEEETNDLLLDALTKGAFKGVLNVDIDGSGKLVQYEYDLEKYKDGGKAVIPADMPGVDIIYQDWLGKDYSGEYTISKLFGTWQQEMDNAYKEYLDNYDKTKYGNVVSRNEFRDAMAIKDESGTIIGVKSGDPKEIVKKTVSATTPSGTLEQISKGTLQPENITKDQFKALSLDDMALKNIKDKNYGFYKLPEKTTDINDVVQNLDYTKFNPPKFAYTDIDGLTTPLKLSRVYITNGVDSKGPYNRLNYVYLDANEQPKLYNTRKFMIPSSDMKKYSIDPKSGSFVLNGVTVEIPNGIRTKG